MEQNESTKVNNGSADGSSLSLSLHTVHFDGEGSGTRESFSYEGRYTEKEGVCSLLYTERGEDGDATAVTVSFEKSTPCVVKLEKSGAVSTEMRFAAGEPFSACYTVTGLCTLAAEGSVRAVENSLSERGGRLRLDYTLTVGGVCGRTVMTLTAKAADEGEEDAPCR